MTTHENHVAVDLDDVTVDFWPGLLEAFRFEYDVLLPQMHPWSDEAKAFAKHRLFVESGYEDWWGWLRERQWLWSTCPAVPGAIGGIARLRAAGWYVEAVTSKPKWAEHIVWEWLGDHQAPFNSVTIVAPGQDKVDFTDAGVIVDDKLETCQSFNKNGRAAVLFDRAGGYNHLDGHEPLLHYVRNWEGIIIELEGIRG